MTRRSALLPIVFLTLVAAGGCATTGEAADRSFNDPNMITVEQLEEAVGGNAFDVVEQLRPRWLFASGRGEIHVYLDERKYGPMESLRSIGIDDIAAMRFYPFNEAIGHFPSFSEGAGVIQVVTH